MKFSKLIAQEACTVRKIVFITNAAYTVPDLPSITPLPIAFIPNAGKPFARKLRDMPTPCVVGDQVLTDGLMAWRLQCPFIQWEGDHDQHVPTWPAIQRRIGGFVAPAIFHKMISSGGDGRHGHCK